MDPVTQLIVWIVHIVVLILMLLTGFAYTTLLERKVVARYQARVGPNRAGYIPLPGGRRILGGWLQPLADAIKLFFKEELIPAGVASGNGPAQLKASLKGPVGGDLAFDVQVAGEGLAAKLNGKGKVPATGRIQGDALVEVREAHLKPLRPGPVAAGVSQLPFRLSSRVALAAGALTFDDIDAKLGASTIHGRFRIDDASPRRVEGALDTNVADGGSLLAIAIGLPPAVKDGPGWSWSSEPLSPGLFGRFAGEIAFRFGRVELLPNVNGRDLRGTVRLGGDNITLDGAGELAGGKLAGIVAFRNAQDGLDARVKMSLAGADTGALFSGAARPPVTGLLNRVSAAA